MKQLQNQKRIHQLNQLKFANEGKSFQYEILLYSLDENIKRTKRALSRHILNYSYCFDDNYQEENRADYEQMIINAENVDILQIIGAVCELKQYGQNRSRCKCPLHQDDSPSLVVYHETNSFYCFGCNEGGSTIDFIMKHNKIGFKEAIQELQKYAN